MTLSKTNIVAHEGMIPILFGQRFFRTEYLQSIIEFSDICPAFSLPF